MFAVVGSRSGEKGIEWYEEKKKGKYRKQNFPFCGLPLARYAKELRSLIT